MTSSAQDLKPAKPMANDRRELTGSGIIATTSIAGIVFAPAANLASSTRARIILAFSGIGSNVPGRATMRRDASARHLAALAGLGCALTNISAGAVLVALSLPANAAEEGKSVYLLGSNASMAGFVPPPGTYVSSINYAYSGEASGSVAASRSLRGRDLSLSADLAVDAQVVLDVLSMLWVAPGQILGGSAGFGILAPVGRQDVAVDIAAKAALTLADGTTLLAGQRRRLEDDTFALGDPLAMAFIGWHQGNLHWKVTGLLNVPIGAYDESSLVNMGFNRWAGDVTGAATWLDPAKGHEVSVAAGFTFNGENPDTNYRTGTEFHVEAALMQHVSPAFAFGVAAYHYQQVTGDGGSGAVLGAFKGEVTAVGPNVNYNFQISGIPIATSARWLHEFDATNRLKGDAGFLTVTMPLGGSK